MHPKNLLGTPEKRALWAERAKAIRLRAVILGAWLHEDANMTVGGYGQRSWLLFGIEDTQAHAKS